MSLVLAFNTALAGALIDPKLELVGIDGAVADATAADESRLRLNADGVRLNLSLD